MNCPQCNNELFQAVQLVKLDENLTATPAKLVYLCAGCGRPIEKPSDFKPRKAVLHITGNSEGNKRKAVIMAGFTVEKYLEWKDDPFWADDNNCFITKASYEKNIELPSEIIFEAIKDY